MSIIFKEKKLFHAPPDLPDDIRRLGWQDVLTPLMKFSHDHHLLWCVPWLARKLSGDAQREWIGTHRQHVALHMPALFSASFNEVHLRRGHTKRLGEFSLDPYDRPIILYEYRPCLNEDQSYFIATINHLRYQGTERESELPSFSPPAVDFTVDMMKNLKIFQWSFSQDTGILEISEDQVAFLGLPDDPDIFSNPLVHMETIFAEDRQAIQRASHAAMDEGTKYDVTYRVWTGQGDLALTRTICHQIDFPRTHRAKLHGSTIVMPKIAKEIERSFIDPLTGLLNRHIFDRDLDACQAQLQAHASFEYTLGIIDVDNFKKVNDHLGHAVGDRYLQALGKLITSMTSDDIKGYRLGGDEFCLIFSGFELNTSRLQRMARELQTGAEAMFRNLFANVFGNTRMGISIGLAQGSRTDPTAISCYERADKNLYTNKRHRKLVRKSPGVARSAIPALVDLQPHQL
ncbi:MAG: GGDEF domain-containing protein [Geminicoccaceae bacterium]|nr:GGDEF domain-containing protein [Geminicoccaceae bacterium]